MMKSSTAKRSIVIVGHKTSVSLEDAFWIVLKEIAKGRDQTVSDLVSDIDKDRKHANLSSAIRLFVLGYVRDEIARYDKPRTHPKKDGHDVSAVAAGQRQ